MKTEYNLVIIGQLFFLVSLLYQVSNGIKIVSCMLKTFFVTKIHFQSMQVDCNSIIVRHSGDMSGEMFKNLEIKLQSKVVEKRAGNKRSKSKDGRIRLLKVHHLPKILIEYEEEM